MGGVRAVVTVICLCLLVAAGSFGQEEERYVRLDFQDAAWEDALAGVARLLSPEAEVEVTGATPRCRVTIQTDAMRLDELLSELNRRYGLAFSERAGRVRIHPPVDLSRMCANDWVADAAGR